MVAELSELFEPQSPLGQKLATGWPYRSDDAMIQRARALLSELTEMEQVETLNAHPRIGEQPARLSARSLREQGTDALPELGRLNDEYERRFGFRFVTFVNRRPQAAIIPELRARLGNDRQTELAAGLQAIVDIAEDRVRRP
jgi:2-oxo-4-hydroxy-4-carboxy--5-ureidoimidazoline (OHCU) decarboxylase